MELELGDRLERLLDAPIPETTRVSLASLDRLLSRWESAVGLVGFRPGDERDRRYFAEALRALAWLPAEGRALDIGTGGGSPALPLAIARSTVAWTLVEANERKAVFLDEAVRALGLRNAAVESGRYETFAPDAPVDVVTLRGVALTGELMEKVSRDIRPGGRLLWFSSRDRLEQAMTELPSSWSVQDRPRELVSRGGFLLVLERRQ